MRLPGRLAAAIEVLETLERERRPVAHVLKEWGNAHRFAGSGDRSAIGNLVHDALRHRQSLAVAMDDDSPRAAILAAAVFLPGYAEHGLPDFEGDQFAPEPLSQKERDALFLSGREADGPPQSASSPHDSPHKDADRPHGSASSLPPFGKDIDNCPDWLRPSMQRVFGEDTVTQVGAMAARAPVDLRLNPFRTREERADKSIARHNAQRDPAFPLLRRIPPTDGFARAPHVTSDEGFLKGFVEIQDAGSQLAAELAVAGIKPRTVLDMCAGAGGKSLALSIFMGGKGQVFAYDVDRHRMKDLWPRVKRSSLHNIQVIEPGKLDGHELAKNGADCVVIDAPCTGTGTWRRHPDTKWRLSESTLTARMDDQKNILNQAASIVKPGGRLAYITCSLLAEENEDQLAAFLKEHTDFTAQNAPAMMASLGRDEVPNYLPSIAVDGFESGALGLRLTPETSGTDGFFIACLTRDAA
ncbi:MAG: RsmB/NOP family class I SAM-dependent RNA methyltransferase [Hyphomicrobiales bacterium]|jgi:16S rRNA (cytosine967-C5)-methyltransferase